jgi:hypothetical protein
VQSVRAWIGSIAVATAAIFAVTLPAAASSATGNVTVQWYAQAVVKMALTPNYATGCGTVKAVFGTQPAPVAPPQGCMAGGAIDFGGILAGTNYLYKFASHLNTQTNDANGVNVYGEGAADFVNTADGSSTPLYQTLYYLNSTSGGADSNTGFSASFPFNRTTASVAGNSFATAPTISYATYPAPIASTLAGGSADFYYDYQLKVPPLATNGQYYVWIVYTVVAK